MPTNPHQDTARALLNLWESNPTARLDDIVTPGYLAHQEGDVGARTTPRNLEQFRALVGGYQGSFSDSSVDVSAQLAQGDLVATHWRLTATHTGDYETEEGTLAPTGRTVSWCGISLDRFEGDRIAESWVAWDKFGFYKQLGLVK